MCSVNDDDCGIEERNPIISKTNLDVSKCKKCEENETVIVLRGKDAYCKNCFLASSTHKFRATLGKSKIIRPNDNILVAHSGSAASSVLLHLIHAGMHESAHKRLIFKSKVLYIDEGILEEKTHDEQRTTVEKIANQLKTFDFSGFTTKINESLSESDLKIFPIDSPGEENAKEEEETKNTFLKLSEQSAKNDLLVKLRTRLLIRAARHLNCNKIFTAETATSLSISILSNITMGRGAHLSLDVGFADTRISDIMILRPMRAFTNLEIDYYQRFHKIQSPLEFPKTTNQNLKSIQTLIDQFVNEMDKESHSTVSTVLRTGEKLCTLISDEKFEKYCILCNSPLDTTINGDISALQAINYSEFVSTNVVEPHSEKIEPNSENFIGNCETNDERIGNSENNCNCSSGKRNCGEKNENILVILKNNLCYGCRLIVVNFKDVKDIPSFMLNKARNLMSFEKMHEEIADFLL
ncbi:cytoplasmic tRNA 2-thiolation protein 2 [Leptopilina heterotoma]|uniref:cytoplasmic tRNA 2-thiolation protein 2 n=1 Tax=Leptopilina heterotoma TaxID=63436 RepID=UPI001CA90D90|nr:cytoplasmic tRNA 2-thiolation protein 2 [Leptopilina heterotoma]